MVKFPVACFAPPLTEEKLQRYIALIEALPLSELRDVLRDCYNAVKTWWELPVSKEVGDKFRAMHKGKEIRVAVTPLSNGLQQSLFAVVPWPQEVEYMKQVLEREELDGELRHAAYHLLWYTAELAHDREPLTQEAL